MNISERHRRDAGMAVTLAALLGYWFSHRPGWLSLALGALLLTMTIPGVFLPISYLLQGFSRLMERLVSKVILSLVFFLVICPVGLLRRLAGYDSMAVKQWQAGRGSVFKERRHCYEAKELERLF